MTPKRFRELQEEAEDQGSGQCSIRGDELEELLHNSISLMSEYANKAKEHKEEFERFRFTSQIFMGSGSRTLMQVGRVYLLLNEALGILGGSQQPPSCHESPSEDEDERRMCAKKRVDDIARELYVCLSGKQVPDDSKLREVLTWLDRRGGLGLDAHARIAAVLNV